MEIEYKKFSSIEDVLKVYKFCKNLLSEPYAYFTFINFYILYEDHCFLAMNNNNLIGAIICRKEKNEKGIEIGYIGMLAVELEFRNQGIGRNLMFLAMKSFEKIKIKEIYLEVKEDNISSIEFYKKFGFYKVDYFEKYYLDLGNAYKMKLCL